MWLAEAAGLRLLLDPLLGPTYHAGVFAPVPARRIDLDALQPDVIVVTHRHPDHFDLPSLDALAQRYPEAVVLTADVLVGQTCQRLGFRHVSLLGPWQHLPLDGAALLTTPSYCDVEEWGVMLATDDGVVWNQVDTELRDQVRPVLARAAELLDRPALAERLELGIVRWQPLLQVNAALGRATAFPARGYGAELDRIAACRAQALIPGAAGSQLVPAEHWLNRFAYPVSPERLRRDLARRCPDAAVYPARVGASWRLHEGTVTPDEDNPLVEITDTTDGRRFRPLERPPLTDPNPGGQSTAALRAIIDPWIRDALGPAALRHVGPRGGAVLALEVVYPDQTDQWTLAVEADRLRLHHGGEDGAEQEPDLRNAIAASDLADVIAGRAPWGRPLLAGRLRSCGALYTVDEGGLKPMKLPTFFLYLALPYARASERWVEAEVERLLATRVTPRG